MKDLAVALALTLAVQALISMTVVAPAVLAPVAQGDVGVVASSIGIFTALVYLTAVISAPVGGTFVARNGAVRVSQCCLLFAGLGFALCVFAQPAVLAVAALLIGCGYGPATPASTDILVGRTPDRMRNLVMSVRQSGVPVGGALAGLLVPALLEVMEWRTVVLLLSLLFIPCILVLQTLRQRYDTHRRPGGERPALITLWRMVFADAQLRQNALASFVYAGMQWCLASFLVVFLTERAQVSLAKAGFALSAAMLAGVVGRVIWGVAADRVRNARAVLGVLGIVMSLCALFTSQVTSSWSLAAIVVLSVIYGATAIGWNGVYVAEVARIAPAGQLAPVTGAALAFTYLGVVVMPFLFWLIVTLSRSYAAAFIAAAALTLAAALSYLRPARPPTPSR